MTAPASPLTCHHVCTSKMCFYSLLHLPVVSCLLLPPSASSSASLQARCQLLSHSTLSRKDQAHPQQLPQAHPHVVLLSNAISSGYGAPHVTLPPPRPLCCCQLICARSQNLLLVFPHWLQNLLLLYRCSPETSLPSNCKTQSHCFQPEFCALYVTYHIFTYGSRSCSHQKIRVGRRAVERSLVIWNQEQHRCACCGLFPWTCLMGPLCETFQWWACNSAQPKVSSSTSATTIRGLSTLHSYTAYPPWIAHLSRSASASLTLSSSFHISSWAQHPPSTLL